jgi:peroxiredoxin
MILFSAAVVSAELHQEGEANLPPTDLERVKVGGQAPEFTLGDMDGRLVSLSEFRGKKHVILVFYRGFWWAYCVSQLGKLKSLLTPAQKEKVQILAISPDTHKASKQLAENLKKRFSGEYDFPLLADTSHNVIDRYGILNPNTKGWPHPATYIIDTEGVVRWKYVEVDYSKRPTNEQVLQELMKVLN